MAKERPGRATKDSEEKMLKGRKEEKVDDSVKVLRQGMGEL